MQALAVYRVVESWRVDPQSCVLVFESSGLGLRTICDSTQKAGVPEAALLWLLNIIHNNKSITFPC